MNWKILKSEESLEDIKLKSGQQPQVIFKHSTRCATSSMVKNRLDRATEPDGMDFYFVDVIADRSLSNKIAAEFLVEHESPQVLVIKNGECIYDESHTSITMNDLLEQARA